MQSMQTDLFSSSVFFLSFLLIYLFRFLFFFVFGIVKIAADNPSRLSAWRNDEWLNWFGFGQADNVITAHLDNCHGFATKRGGRCRIAISIWTPMKRHETSIKCFAPRHNSTRDTIASRWNPKPHKWPNANTQNIRIICARYLKRFA